MRAHTEMKMTVRAVLAAAGVGALATGAAGLPPQTARSPVGPSVRQEDPIPAQWRAESVLMEAIERAAVAAPDPGFVRGTLLARMRNSNTCFPGGLTQEEMDQQMRETRLLPPTQLAPNLQDRFFVDSQVWYGNGGLSQSGTSRRAQLTYSFPADGTTWGLTCPGLPWAQAPSNLDFELTDTFGSLDRGREFLRSALAAWRRVAGVTYTEVTDDGAPMSTSTVHPTTRGDIRIGGYYLSGVSNVVTNTPLAYNGFPSNGGFTSCSGGDMCINTSWFNVGGYLASPGSSYLYLRNTVAHEHGHGLGCKHSVPCNLTKLMEPYIDTTKIVLLMNDEIRAAARNYGDRFSGNNWSGAAKDFGNLTSPVVRSVIERDLATNGNVAPDPPNPVQSSQEDWFTFTLSSTQTVTITVAPTGTDVPVTPGCSVSGANNDPSYCMAEQSSECNGSIQAINSKKAGNLALELRTPGGVNTSMAPLAGGDLAGLGLNEVVSQSLSAGTYFVRVWDNFGSSSTNQTVQTYDLTIRVGSSLAPPQVIAGLNHKLAKVNQTTTFIGNHNSSATEAGATLPTANFAWDLDGDGVYDTVYNGNTQPGITYRSNGTYMVKCRITDSLGTAGTDTITVQVSGALTTVTNACPKVGAAGTVVPMTITGTNFKGVTNATQVTVTAMGVPVPGVTVIGTPSVNGLGTQITGLSFSMTAGVAAGVYDITVSNGDGLGAAPGTGAGKFTVGGTTNDECSGATSWGSGTGAQSFSLVCATTSATQTCGLGTVYNDAWYSWTAPVTGTVDVLPSIFGATPMVSMFGPSPACPPAGAPLACGNNAGFSAPVIAGQVYLFQTGVNSASSGGGGTVTLTVTEATGACCAGSSCSVGAAGVCGGVFQGSGTVCDPSPCPPPSSGTCCSGATCAVTAAAACTGANTAFVPASSSCNAVGVNTTPCCRADFNKAGGVSVQDIFDFLGAWFSGNPQADFTGNGAGTPTVQSIFDYLAAWFTGGC